jgi:hypothetical protein
LLLGEPVQFPPNSGQATEGLLSEFRKIANFLGFIPVKIFLYTEDLPVIERQLYLLWFGVDSIPDLGSSVQAVVRVFWGGKYPKSGLHMNFPKWIRTELCQMIVPELRCGSGSNGVYALEVPMKSTQATVTILMPAGRYFRFDW